MSIKKGSIKYSFCIGLPALVLYTVLKFHWYSTEFGALFCTELKEYLMDISLGVFTGAVLTFALSLKEYFIERKKALLAYYKACRKWMLILFEVGYLDFKIPIDLLVGYYSELRDNKEKAGYNKSLREAILKNGDIENDSLIYEKNYKEQEHIREKALREWLWENEEERVKKMELEPYQKEEYLNDIFSSRISEFDKEIKELGEKYSKLNKLRFDEVNDCYTDFDFLFFNNKKYKTKILYDKIYLVERNMLSKMRALTTYVYEMEKNDITSKIHFFTAVDDLQKEFCGTEKNETGECIYHKKCFEIDLELYNVLKKAYGHKYDKNKEEIPKIQEYIVAEHLIS